MSIVDKMAFSWYIICIVIFFIALPFDGKKLSKKWERVLSMMVFSIPPTIAIQLLHLIWS